MLKVTFHSCLNHSLHEAATFQLDLRVCLLALIRDDMDLLTQLNARLQREATYHRNCLLNLYNRARNIKEMACKGKDDEHATAGLPFAELVFFL